MANDNDDPWVREVIRTVKDLSVQVTTSQEAATKQLVEYRQDSHRSILPLFQRLVGIDKRLDEESKDRPARQRQLDTRLIKQDAKLDVLSQRLSAQDVVLGKQNQQLETIGRRLEGQDQALGRQDKTLASQDTMLIRIFKWQRWRAVVEVAILIVLIIGFWYLRHGGV